MKIITGKRIAVCENCGKRILRGDRTPPAESLSYVKERESRQRSMKAEERRIFRGHLLIILALTAVLSLVIIGFAISWFSRPQIDPFVQVAVSFSGLSGRGEAAVVPAEGAGALPDDIEYRLSKRRDLTEGETIELSAYSTAYRLTYDHLDVTVTGLDHVLSSLDEFDGASLAVLHGLSEEINASHTDPSSLSRNEMLSGTPVRLFLLTDGKGHNIVYDIYQADFQLADGTVRTVYLAAYYEDLIIRAGDPPRLEYTHSMYAGNTISLGGAMDSPLAAYETLDEVREGIAARGKDMTMSEK